MPLMVEGWRSSIFSLGRLIRPNSPNSLKGVKLLISFLINAVKVRNFSAIADNARAIPGTAHFCRRNGSFAKKAAHAGIDKTDDDER
jgi:hypothetical protein